MTRSQARCAKDWAFTGYQLDLEENLAAAVKPTAWNFGGEGVVPDRCRSYREPVFGLAPIRPSRPGGGHAWRSIQTTKLATSSRSAVLRCSAAVVVAIDMCKRRGSAAPIGLHKCYSWAGVCARKVVFLCEKHGAKKSYSVILYVSYRRPANAARRRQRTLLANIAQPLPTTLPLESRTPRQDTGEGELIWLMHNITTSSITISF